MEIGTTRIERLKREDQRRLEKQQKKEKAAIKAKLIFLWIIVISLIAVNLVLEKNVFDELVYNVHNDMDLFSGVWLWPALWPAWIVIAVTLLATAILGRILLKDKNASWICVIEVVALLVFALVFAVVFHLTGSILTDIIGGPIFCALLYAVPVVVSGFFSIGICVLDEGNESKE